MSGLEERPTSLRRAPRPAADESVDPIDVAPAAAAPAPETELKRPAAPARKTAPVATSAAQGGGGAVPRTSSQSRASKRPEPTLPFSTRLSADVFDLIIEAADLADVKSQRAAVEQAIRQTWGHLLSD